MTISKSLALSIFVSLNLLANTNSTAQNTNSKTSKKEKADTSLASYEKYIDDTMNAHLKEFMELVSIPSISSIPSHKPDVARAAAWIVNKLKAIGMTNCTTNTNRRKSCCIWKLGQSTGKTNCFNLCSL